MSSQPNRPILSRDSPDRSFFDCGLDKLTCLTGYLWASPNTLFGLFAGWILRGRFQWVNGVVEIDGPGIAGCLRRLPIPAAAMTMGHVVFGQNQACLDRTRRHERVHVRQYARWGPFFLPVYLGISLLLYALRRDGYRDNPFEVEAYAVDDPTVSAEVVNAHESEFEHESELTSSLRSVPDDSPSTVGTDKLSAIDDRSEKRWRAKKLFRVLLPVLLLVGCWLAFRVGGEEIVAWRESLGGFAPLVTVPIHAIVAAAPIPSDVIVIANGALYSYPLAVFLGWLGWLLGSVLEFFAIRLITGVESVQDAHEKMPRWLARLPAGSPWFLILGRQIPGVGAHLTVAVAAAAGVTFRRYFFLTAVAIIPGALLLSAIGANWLSR